jgi:hypothetical protein
MLGPCNWGVFGVQFVCDLGSVAKLFDRGFNWALERSIVQSQNDRVIT